MPTVDRIGPYRIFFYSNEGDEPPHVHVQRDRNVSKFWLSPVALVGALGFKPHELREMERLVAENQQAFLEAWYEFFGR